MVCSGKVGFDIQGKLSESKDLKNKVTVLRVEELAPFPIKQIEEQLRKSGNSNTEIVWVQEEPCN